LLATHNFAVRTVRDSIRVARSLEDRAQASIKPDTSPVTVAALSIQAIVAARLAGAFPQDSLFAEEDARLLRAAPALSRQVTEVVRQVITDATIRRVEAWIGDGGSDLCSRCWTLDPIDGTEGFLTEIRSGSRASFVRLEMSGPRC
jgi:3'(2'), 5'-bisphosphate nucleotidase